MIQIENESFAKLNDYIRKLETEVKMLREANEFLNEHIKKYNKEFADVNRNKKPTE